MSLEASRVPIAGNEKAPLPQGFREAPLPGFESARSQDGSGALRRFAAGYAVSAASSSTPSGAVDRSAGLLTGERLANTLSFA